MGAEWLIVAVCIIYVCATLIKPSVETMINTIQIENALAKKFKTPGHLSGDINLKYDKKYCAVNSENQIECNESNLADKKFKIQFKGTSNANWFYGTPLDNEYMILSKDNEKYCGIANTGDPNEYSVECAYDNGVNHYFLLENNNDEYNIKYGDKYFSINGMTNKIELDNSHSDFTIE